MHVNWGHVAVNGVRAADSESVVGKQDFSVLATPADGHAQGSSDEHFPSPNIQ